MSGLVSADSMPLRTRSMRRARSRRRVSAISGSKFDAACHTFDSVEMLDVVGQVPEDLGPDALAELAGSSGSAAARGRRVIGFVSASRISRRLPKYS